MVRSQGNVCSKGFFDKQVLGWGKETDTKATTRIQKSSGWCYQHYGIASTTENIAEHITFYFNQQHLEALTDDPKSTGLMGLMRKPHGTALLKAQGTQLQINRITNETMVVKRGLTRANSQQLTYGDCIKWCKALRVPTKKNKPEMVAEQKNLFDGRPANHHINP